MEMVMGNAFKYLPPYKSSSDVPDDTSTQMSKLLICVLMLLIFAVTVIALTELMDWLLERSKKKSLKFWFAAIGLSLLTALSFYYKFFIVWWVVGGKLLRYWRTNKRSSATTTTESTEELDYNEIVKNRREIKRNLQE